MSKATEALERACSEIESAPESQRNETLNTEALKVGHWTGGGLLNRDEAEQVLLDAARDAGLPDSESKATIRSGLNAGERDPYRPDKGRSGRGPGRGTGMKAEHEHGADPDHESEPNPKGLFIGTSWPDVTRPENGETFKLTFEKMANRMQKAPDAKGASQAFKDALPQWALARFEGNHATLKKHKAAFGLVLDVDKGNWAAEDIEREFGRWSFVAYTTWRHKPGRARWRVMLPLARTVSQIEHRRLTAWAKLKFPGAEDLNPAQRFYTPVKRPGYLTAHHKGKPLNPDAALAELPGLEADAVLGLLGIEHLVDAAAATIERRVKGEEIPIGTPWERTNELMGGGLWPGLTILVGATGAGKTQWAMQVARYAASEGTPVLYIGLELDSLGFVCRLIGMCAGVQWSDLYHGKESCHVLGGENLPGVNPLEVIAKYRGEVAGLPLRFEPGTTVQWNPAELVELCRAMRTKYPGKPFLVVLDFLQLVGGDLKAPLRERISDAAYMARGAARDHGASVILISSIARANYSKLTGRDDKGERKGSQLGEGHPGRLVGLGKESGDIEHAADAVLVLGSNDAGDIDSPGPRGIFLAVAKVRAGLPNWGGFHFDGTEFTEVDYKKLLVEEGNRVMRAANKGERVIRDRDPGELPPLDKSEL